MSDYSYSRLTNHVLLRTLTDAVARDRAATSELLALIAEVDRRGLFRQRLPRRARPRHRLKRCKANWFRNQ